MRTFVKWLRRYTVVTLLAVAMSAAVSTAALSHPRGPDTTDPPPSGCLNGAVCMFYDANYSGAWYMWTSPGTSCHNLSAPLPGEVSSFINLTGHSVTVYNRAGCSGGFATFAGVNHPNLSGTGWNDEIRSFQI